MRGQGYPAQRHCDAAAARHACPGPTPDDASCRRAGRLAEFYDPVVLDTGGSMYIDATMGHAYILAEGCEEAEVVGVMSSGDAELMKSLLDMHEGQRAREPGLEPDAIR